MTNGMTLLTPLVRICIGISMLVGALQADAQMTTYCCDVAAEAAFFADLAGLGLPTSTAGESFEEGQWLDAQVFPQPTVSHLNITWFPLVEGGFSTSTGGGSVHDGAYLMLAVDGSGIFHPVPDGYSFSSGNFQLHGVGGWFNGSGAKLGFVVDGDPNRVDFTGGEATITAWKFLGFIEGNLLGFNQVDISTIDEGGGETEIFFSDDFTLVADEGAFVDTEIFLNGFEDGTLVAWSASVP